MNVFGHLPSSRNIIRYSRNLSLRCFLCTRSTTMIDIMKQSESTVGYSTSFLNLRWLLTDEIANLASHVNKLIGTDHPILKTAKKILIKSDLPSWGLIVLLIAKSSSVGSKIPDVERDANAGILHTQRMVAEVVEILRTGIFFHKSLQLRKEVGMMPSQIHQGNKIALLIGDYLITRSYHILAEINNSEIEEIISSALRELCEAEFFGERNEENEAIPSNTYIDDSKEVEFDHFNIEPYDHNKYMGRPKAEWALRNFLQGASLLGKGCLSAVKLGGHSEELQHKSFTFGVNLALCYRARQDLLFLNEFSEAYVSRVSAPILFHLGQNEGFDIGIYSGARLRKEISRGEGMKKTEGMLQEFREKALSCLSSFPNSRAKSNLTSLVLHI